MTTSTKTYILAKEKPRTTGRYEPIRAMSSVIRQPGLRDIELTEQEEGVLLALAERSARRTPVAPRDLPEASVTTLLRRAR